MGASDPLRHLVGQRVARLRNGGQQAKGLAVERADHDRQRRLVEIFAPGHADAVADGADPGFHAGARGKLRHDVVEGAVQGVGRVDEPDIGVRRRRAEVREAGFDQRIRGSAGRMGQAEAPCRGLHRNLPIGTRAANAPYKRANTSLTSRSAT